MDKRVTTAIRLIRESGAGQPTVSNLSQRVRLSPTRLRQLFKHEIGLSPIQYARRVRMQQAGKLLRTAFLSVKEVAFMCGAKDVSHFVRDFKKTYGLTPGKFRDGADES